MVTGLTGGPDERGASGADTQDPVSRFSFEVDQTVKLTTVGIDIGSSTSQMSVSHVELERVNTRYVTTRRDLVYESRILLTPYVDAETIDTAALGTFFEEQYGCAGIAPADVDTGALILTGLALAKHNSRSIAELFAAQAGTFVAVSAGDAIEATLASRGAGSEQLSLRAGAPVVHIDMGGGTTKYAYVDAGRVMRVAAIDVGARLVLVDDGDRVVRVEEPAAAMLDRMGRVVKVGDVLDDSVRQALVTHMADQVLAHAGLVDSVHRDPGLLRTPPLFDHSEEAPAAAAVTFSGGVSEYIYGREQRTFGDLGFPLAGAVTRRMRQRGRAVTDAPRGIRATVLGASQYSLQLTGNTVYASDTSLVPIRNMPVVKPDLPLDADELNDEALRHSLWRVLAAREVPADNPAVAIALHWQGSATFPRLEALARALLATAGPDVVEEHRVPLVVVCDADIAGLIGTHLSALGEGRVPVLSLDGIEVSEFDFLDVGAFVPGTGALPVVVKSLLFPTA